MQEIKMRLDKFLKTSRLIKRRTVACEACDGGRVTVNGVTAKPARTVKAGDIIEIHFGGKTLKVEVLLAAENVRKEQTSEMYRVL